MCIRSVDFFGFVYAGAAVAIAAMFSPGASNAQGYPSTFEFGEPATEQEIAAVRLQFRPTAGGCLQARATMRPESRYTRSRARPATAPT
jgi:hypothetical protein